MNNNPIIECVPNFSEGRDMTIIKEITDCIESVDGIKLLDVDPGYATNRTVVTFVGHPDQVIQAAFLGIKKASELIDMSKHKGAHPRMGATDVCPLIPISGITMEEVVEYAHKLGDLAGSRLDIPFYLYESAATRKERKNLAIVRSGEYEGLAEKLSKSEWTPDYGPAVFNPKSGATAIGARDFLIAYNVNLNTSSVRRANSVAFDVREKGRVKRTGNPVTGPIVIDADGNSVREPGTCKSVKAIGWYIEEYGQAQISMNLTDIKDTSLHEAFEACRRSANARGLRVTGSELVGLVPKKVMLDAGKYFLHQQERSTGIAEEEIIRIAIKSLGLDELAEFDPKKKIIEYQLDNNTTRPLISMNLVEFANETASESIAPGGGSISAYVGSLGAALSAMVSNISGHKRGWDDKWKYFSDEAEKAHSLQDRLLYLVDEDTKSFNAIIQAMRLPKASAEEKTFRKEAMEKATKYAVEVPFEILKSALDIFPLAKEMVSQGNQNSLSDAGVAALCAWTAAQGAFMNVTINCMDITDKKFVEKYTGEGEKLVALADQYQVEIKKLVMKKIKGA